ncbi:MAG TPA: TRL domain-containing protein [Planctomycetota bacterium]|jgi:hypothetical protein|nr:TRL domain-containing protein [Planctomycetota bacterium]
MPRRLALLLGPFALAALPGCFYLHTRSTLDTDLDKTTLGSKVGESHHQGILWAVAWGDAGTKAAAENGGIKVINHADQEMLMVFFGAYYRYTTIVYGD